MKAETFHILEPTDDEIDSVLADNLLESWYYYSLSYRPNLGVPRIAPYCKQSKSSRQYETVADLTDQHMRKDLAEAVEFCVDQLALNHRSAIGIEMKNRAVKARVWSCKSASTYVEALAAVLPIMRAKGLFD
jgi:hypothetical protein